MNIYVVTLVLCLKFFLPLLFFLYPFQASWLNFILDTSDGDILMHFGLNPALYQPIDKSADLFTYFVMLLVGRKWRIGGTIIALFTFRAGGQLIFFLTGNDEVFFFFPNFLEPLFMIYSLLLFVDKTKAYWRYKKYLLPIWILIISYKMWNEYNTHIAKIDLSTYFFGFNN